MRKPEDSIARLTRAGMDPDEAAAIVAQLDPRDTWIEEARRISGSQLRYRVAIDGVGDYWYLISE